jgi:hypothetical protein
MSRSQMLGLSGEPSYRVIFSVSWSWRLVAVRGHDRRMSAWERVEKPTFVCYQLNESDPSWLSSGLASVTIFTGGAVKQSSVVGEITTWKLVPLRLPIQSPWIAQPPLMQFPNNATPRGLLRDSACHAIRQDQGSSSPAVERRVCNGVCNLCATLCVQGDQKWLRTAIRCEDRPRFSEVGFV